MKIRSLTYGVVSLLFPGFHISLRDSTKDKKTFVSRNPLFHQTNSSWEEREEFLVLDMNKVQIGVLVNFLTHSTS